MASSPRVLFVNHSSVVSGAELVLLDVVKPWAGASAFLFEEGPLAPALRERGLSVTVSSAGGRLAGIRRDSSALGAMPMMGALAGVLRELARSARAHDLLYANSQKAFVAAALCAGLTGRPLVWHLHDIIDPSHFGRAQRLLQIGLANRFAARVITPSRAAGDAFVAAGGRAELVRVVANGIDAPPPPTERDVLRRMLGLPDSPVVGVFSRLARWKGQHVVLEALARLPGVHAAIVGAPLFGEDAYASELRQQAETLGLVGRAHFLGQRSDVPQIMACVDAVVHPSIHPEPFGRTLVEAMLAGTPVVATDAGASAEILETGACGTLVPPGDAQALAAALTRVLAGGPAIERQVDRAGKRARETYGTAAMQAAISDIVLAVAPGSGAVSPSAAA